MRRPLLLILGVATLMIVLALLWRMTPLSEWGRPRALASMLIQFRSSYWGPLVVIGFFVVGGLVMVPVTGMILATALVFSPWMGFACSLAGSLLSALLGFAIGHVLGKETLRRVAGKRFDKLTGLVGQNGIAAVLFMRLLPVAPFTLVNLVAGGLRIPFHYYLIGSLLGLLPGLVLIHLFSRQVKHLIQDPGLYSAITFLAVVLLLAASAWGTRRLSRSRLV